jgi:hypothetical protein
VHARLKERQDIEHSITDICDCGLNDLPNDEGMVSPSSNSACNHSVNVHFVGNGVMFGVMDSCPLMIVVFQTNSRAIDVYYSLTNRVCFKR